MPSRAFSIEDGNIGNKSILTSRREEYSDIDLSFAKKGSGDIFKKSSGASVKQAVRNFQVGKIVELIFKCGIIMLSCLI